MKNLLRWTLKLLSLPRILVMGALNLMLAPAPRFTAINGRIMPCREGGWVAAVIAGVGAVGGMVSQNKAGGALDSSSRLANEEANAAVRDKRLSSQLYGDYGAFGLPATEKYISAAEQPIDPEAAANAAAGEVDRQSQGQQDAMARYDASYGINPNSGRSLAQNADYNLNTAISRAGAATAARKQAVQQTLNNLRGASDAGQGLLSGAESFAGMQPGALNGAGNMEAGIAGMYGQEAAGYGQLAGFGLSTYMNNNKNPSTNNPPTYTNAGQAGPPNN